MLQENGVKHGESTERFKCRRTRWMEAVSSLLRRSTSARHSASVLGVSVREGVAVVVIFFTTTTRAFVVPGVVVACY